MCGSLLPVGLLYYVPFLLIVLIECGCMGVCLCVCLCLFVSMSHLILSLHQEPSSRSKPFPEASSVSDSVVCPRILRLVPSHQSGFSSFPPHSPCACSLAPFPLFAFFIFIFFQREWDDFCLFSATVCCTTLPFQVSFRSCFPH